MKNLKSLMETDLGVNAEVLLNLIKTKENSIFVDLGVRDGNSSTIFLEGSTERENKVYGVDISFETCSTKIKKHPNYTMIENDSVIAGDEWDGGEIDVLFVDTIHSEPHVMCELHKWYPHMKKGGSIVFHDSNWPDGKIYKPMGKSFGRVDTAIKKFFNIDTLNFVDDNIDVKTYPKSWGMTFIKLLKKYDYIGDVSDWDSIYEERAELIELSIQNGGRTTSKLSKFIK